jgi:hypothetical protein
MQHPLQRIAWCICRVAKRPVIPNSVGKHGPVVAKIRRRNRPTNRFEALQALMLDTIPEMERTIRACSAECCFVYRMETNIVHCPYLGDILSVGRISVATKRKVNASGMI